MGVGDDVVGGAGRLGRSLMGSGAGTDQVLADMARDEPEMRLAASYHARNTLARKAILDTLLGKVSDWAMRSQPYFRDSFPAEFARRTASIPDASLVAPKPTVFYPALEGLAYSTDEEELKNLYLGLLATAVDGRDPDGAHPAHATIIQQLTSDEARVLDMVLRVSAVTAARVIVRQGDGLGLRHETGTMLEWVEDDTGKPSAHKFPAHYVDNWERLGLVKVEFGVHLIGAGAYDWVSKSREYIDARDRVQGLGDGEVADFDAGLLQRTKFGEGFARAVGMLGRS